MLKFQDDYTTLIATFEDFILLGLCQVFIGTFLYVVITVVVLLKIRTFSTLFPFVHLLIYEHVLQSIPFLSLSLLSYNLFFSVLLPV